MASVFGATAAFALPARVFVIDSTTTLFSFDIKGDAIAKVDLGGPVSLLNGGGITVDGQNVYVTAGQPENEVLAFKKGSLEPVRLPQGAFSGLFVPRGIAFDTHNQRFYVANGGASINVYNSKGDLVQVSGGFPLSYGPSGAAFDAKHNTIWIGNYFGATQAFPPQYSVAEYNEDGTAANTFDYSVDFVAHQHHKYEQPYAISYCPIVKGVATNIVAVGFKSDTSGRGIGEAQTFSAKGSKYGHEFRPALTDPNAISCTQDGHIYVADDSGLRRFTAAGQDVGLPVGGFPGLTAPIYGVFFEFSGQDANERE